MMPQFMGKHISLGKVSGSAKALLQLVIKAKIDVNFFVRRAVERTSSGAGRSTSGSRCIAKQHQLGMAIRNPLLLKDSGPGLLCVIQHERYELYHGLFPGVAGTVGLMDARACASAATQQREEIPFE